MDTATPQVTPVVGYRAQSPENLALVNTNKQTEEALLRQLDALAQLPNVDKRWLSIARTHIEQGFMAMNRSIMRPERIKLPGDTQPQSDS